MKEPDALIFNLSWHSFIVDHSKVEYGGRIESIGVFGNKIVLLFGRDNCDKRVASTRENALCFSTDGTLLWRLDMAQANVPFDSVGDIREYRMHDGREEIYLISIGAYGYWIDLNTGKFVSAEYQGR